MALKTVVRSFSQYNKFRIMKRIFLFLALVLGTVVSAQSVLDYDREPNAQDDNFYIKHHYETNRVIPYAKVREADVMWAKRYWQRLDMKQKLNHPLYYPIVPIQNRKSLFEVMIGAVVDEERLTAYDDDEFKYQLTRQEVMDRIFSVDTITDYDINTNQAFQRLDTVAVQSANIMEYLIKEDWFFDKKRSVMEVRILGICPVAYVENRESGNIEKQQMFWLWFPELRPVIANFETFNRQNDAERRSFDEVFHLRMFESYIVEESNVYDRTIYDYNQLNALDQLLEAERIKTQIRNFELDLWEY